MSSDFGLGLLMGGAIGFAFFVIVKAISEEVNQPTPPRRKPRLTVIRNTKATGA